MEKVILHGIKFNSCPKSEVPLQELGRQAGHHRARDYTTYERYKGENLSLYSKTHDAAHARYTNET